MQLEDALTQIADIRDRLTRAGTFRGYRSLPVAVSGLLAFAAALAQSRWITQPEQAIDDYVMLWGSIALISVTLAGGEMWLRLRREGSLEGSWVQQNMSLTAVELFLPCLIAGAVVTFAILNFQIQTATLLPGIWMVLFGLGMFASRPILPRPICWVGGYYLLASIVAISGRVDPLGAWTMGIIFGVGQLLTAGLLFWKLEYRGGIAAEGR